MKLILKNIFIFWGLELGLSESLFLVAAATTAVIAAAIGAGVETADLVAKEATAIIVLERDFLF